MVVIDLLDFEGTQVSYKYITSGVPNIFGYSLKKGTYYFQIYDGYADASSELRYKFSVDSISSKLPSFQMYLFDKELVSLGSAYDDGQGSLRYKKYLVPGQYFIKIFSGYAWDGESSEKRFYFTIKTGS